MFPSVHVSGRCPCFREGSLFQGGVGIERCPCSRGLEYRGVIVSWGWNREVPHTYS